MPTKSQPKPSRDKVTAHRRRLRRKGLRPVQIWLPDVTTSRFALQAHSQSVAVARGPQARADQAFIDAISESE